MICYGSKGVYLLQGIGHLKEVDELHVSHCVLSYEKVIQKMVLQQEVIEKIM